MKSVLLATACVLGLAQAAAAQAYVCEQTAINRGGFRSFKDARTYFPKRTSYELRRTGSRATPFGAGDVRKSGDRVIMHFRGYQPWASEPIWPVRVSLNVKTGRYSSKLLTPAGFVDGAVATGKCVLR